MESRALRASGLAIVGLVASIVMFTNLGGPRLWDRDEPRNAGCAFEMLARNDWVTPVFNDELRGHKPVLLYWLIMSAYGLLGVNEFSARFWSAALAVATSALTAWMGAHLFGRSTGILGGVILATSLMFGVAGRAATPDSLLIFTTTLALAWFARKGLPAAGTSSNSARGFPHEGRFSIVFYGILGLGALAKGPVGFLLPCAVVGGFLLVTSDTPFGRSPGWWNRIAAAGMTFVRACWRMRLGLAVTMLLLVAAPWYVWVGYRTNGQFLYDFFVEHNLNRARRPMEGHEGPFFYYLLAIAVGFFPWSIFLLPTILEAVHAVRRRAAKSPGVVFLLCWLCVWVGIFTVAQTKLPSYITPCYPALALLTAYFLERWRTDLSIIRDAWPRAAFGVLATVGVGMVIGLPFAAHRYLPGDEWLATLGAVPILAALGATWLVHLRRRTAAVSVLAMSAMLLCVGMFGLAAQRVDRHQHFDRLLRAAAANARAVDLGALGVLEPSWVFYARRPVRVLADSPSQASANHPTIEQFLAARPDAYVIATRSEFERRRDQLSRDTVIIEEIPYFLKKEKLVLLGRAAPEIARRQP